MVLKIGSDRLDQLGTKHSTNHVKIDGSTVKIAGSIGKNWDLDPFSTI